MHLDTGKDLQEFFSRGVNIIQQGQSWLDHFPTPLSVIRPVSLNITMTYRGNLSKRPIAPETESLVYTPTSLAQTPDL